MNIMVTIYFWSQVKGGHEDVICLQNMASYVVHEKWHTERREMYFEVESIVVTCAKLLKEELCEQEQSKLDSGSA